MNAKLLIAGVLALAFAGVALAAVQVYAPSRSRQPWATIQQGKYLARAGDCESCHTAEGGQPYAGGRPVPTPFGIVYSANITPDPDTGIGAWNEEDFYRAMHDGIDQQGNRLYPAFPYPWYTHMTRGDVDAIKAYLDSVKPVRQVDREPKLGWPFSMRSMLAVWDKLYLDAKPFKPDPERSAEWNRGKYLVDGAGHCGACHSSKNMLGHADTSHPMQGGMAEHVFAPNLGAGERDGLSGWTHEDIVEYLHMDNGAGIANAFPPLRASSAVQAAKPDLLIAVILQGARSPATSAKPTGLMMPAFDSKLDDAEVATLTTYIRNAWGNRGGEISKGDVAKLRNTLASAPR